MSAGAIVNRTQQEIPNEETIKSTEEKAIHAVVKAAGLLV